MLQPKNEETLRHPLTPEKKRDRMSKPKKLALALRNGKATSPALPKSPASRARTRTGKWRPIFLRTLARTPSVTFAAKAAGVPRRTAYAHREQDSEFATAWDDALNQSLDVLEHSVYQR